MTIKPSGGNPPTNPLSFSEISNEFGTPSNKNLGAYRVNGTYGSLSNQPLDTGIPKSGSISFSDFYSKQLNIIVNFYSGGQESRQNAKTRYNQGNVSVVGGFKSKPSNTSGTHVKIHVNKTIGSTKGVLNNVALRTGNWSSGTSLTVDIGNSGKLFGAGGNGGNGGNGSESGDRGSSGTSALGIEFTGSQSGGTTINLLESGSLIQCGFAGGGGGGGGYNDPDKNSEDHASGGGGGGGGAGLPAGTGGDGGGSFGKGDDGGKGSSGTNTAGGAGGDGGGGGGSEGGRGGNGGDSEAAAGGGEGGEGNRGEGEGGGAGGNGSAIRKASGVTFQIGTNNGTISGSTNQTGVS